MVFGRGKVFFFLYYVCRRMGVSLCLNTIFQLYTLARRRDVRRIIFLPRPLQHAFLILCVFSFSSKMGKNILNSLWWQRIIPISFLTLFLICSQQTQILYDPRRTFWMSQFKIYQYHSATHLLVRVTHMNNGGWLMHRITQGGSKHFNSYILNIAHVKIKPTAL